jgi:hypothetical protein
MDMKNALVRGILGATIFQKLLVFLLLIKSSSMKKNLSIFVLAAVVSLIATGCNFAKDFVGNYSVSEACTSGNWTYTLIVTESAAGNNKIIMNNFAYPNLNVVGIVNGHDVTIESQVFTVASNNINISGSGSLNGTTLNVSYTVTGDITDSCTMTATRQ